MKARVIYVEGHEVSVRCKNELVKSLEIYDWDYEVVSGVTPSTLVEEEFPYQDLEGGRLESFRLNSDPVEQKKYYNKKSCLFNHLRFAQDVIDADEPMIFLEHDVKVTAKTPSATDVSDFCFLNIDSAFKPPATLNIPWLNQWYDEHPHQLGLQPFPSDFPLTYYKNSKYFGRNMVPGTSAYILTPQGAERLFFAVKEFGLEQSDFIYNSGVVYMQYMYPSPVRFQNINPNLSHTL